MTSSHDMEDSAWKNYLAEAGAAAFLAVCGIAALSVLAELRFPGLAAALVSPAALVAAATVSAGAALSSMPLSRRSRSGRVAFIAAAVVCTIAAFVAGTAAFHGDAFGAWTPFACALAAAAAFFAAAR
jgi:hypothetical protein